jgi:hypothetical protein
LAVALRDVVIEILGQVYSAEIMPAERKLRRGASAGGVAAAMTVVGVDLRDFHEAPPLAGHDAVTAKLGQWSGLVLRDREALTVSGAHDQRRARPVVRERGAPRSVGTLAHACEKHPHPHPCWTPGNFSRADTGDPVRSAGGATHVRTVHSHNRASHLPLRRGC